jgi:hypothetical protein
MKPGGIMQTNKVVLSVRGLTFGAVGFVRQGKGFSNHDIPVRGLSGAHRDCLGVEINGHHGCCSHCK